MLSSYLQTVGIIPSLQEVAEANDSQAVETLAAVCSTSPKDCPLDQMSRGLILAPMYASSGI